MGKKPANSKNVSTMSANKFLIQYFEQFNNWAMVK